MNKKITVDYIDGYKDAARYMEKIINNAVKKNNSDMLSAVNSIIEGLYLQRMIISDLTENLQQQMDEKENKFDDNNCEKSENLIKSLDLESVRLIINGKKNDYES